jgi:hypothetical protein
VVFRLGRLFDPRPTAIGLGNLLRTMKENGVSLSEVAGESATRGSAAPNAWRRISLARTTIL